MSPHLEDLQAIARALGLEPIDMIAQQRKAILEKVEALCRLETTMEPDVFFND